MILDGMPLDAFDVERGLDELFPDSSQYTVDEARAIGVVREMLWKRQKETTENDARMA